MSFDPETYHRLRWRILWVWMIAVSAVVIISLGIFRGNTATVRELQHTNCKLKVFLLTARAARIDDAIHAKTAAVRADNIKAAIGYSNLVLPFSDSHAVGHCPIPSNLNKPIPKLKRR